MKRRPMWPWERKAAIRAEYALIVEWFNHMRAALRT